MSYIAKNPSVWAQAQPDDYPEPAPIRLSILHDRALSPFGTCAHTNVRVEGAYAWCVADDNECFACGRAHTVEQAKQDGAEAAERLGLRRVYDGWVSPPDEAYTS